MKTLVKSILRKVNRSSKFPQLQPTKYPCPQSQIDEWVSALRSGKYSKSTGSLFVGEESSETYGKDIGYCCLGVKGALCGISDEDLKGNDFLYSEFLEDQAIEYDELTEVLEGENDLTDMLAGLNDKSEITFDDMAVIIEYHMRGRDE